MMKYLLAALLCLLLCGCAQEAPTEETDPPAAISATVSETEPVGMYAQGHPLEAEHQGALRVYPLSIRKVQGMRAMQDGVLVFSGYGNTTLTLLTGEELVAAASITLDFELDQNDPSLRISGGTLSFFDPVNRETVVLDSSLKEVGHVAAPEDLVGTPILSEDRNTLYYCTATAIRAWNLETGIRRAVKELSYDQQAITGLHCEDAVLQCRIFDGGKVQTLFLTADTGQLLNELDGDAVLVTEAERYYAAIPASNLQLLLFGEAAEEPRMLFPEDLNAEILFLPEDHAAVTSSVLPDDRIQLDYYALDTGLRRAVLTLESLSAPKSIVNGSGDSVYFLLYDPETDCDTVYRWEVPHDAADTTVYTDTYHTKASQNRSALAQCQAYAAEIGSKYGIEILVWEDALTVQPWDYEFQAEYLHQVLNQELALLDQRLGQFPEGMLETTISHFTSLKICLVRQITGTAASGSLEVATGVQFLDGTDAYVVIAVGKYSEQALYHELFHVMETHLLNESTAFDQWDSLNPAGFTYHYGYADNETAAVYLEGENRAFVDKYSMSFPKEDRARVFEYACLSGQKDLFASPVLQAKLQALCEGIREAYRLKKSEETFPWEQYLKSSLAYSK